VILIHLLCWHFLPPISAALSNKSSNETVLGYFVEDQNAERQNVEIQIVDI
jgi:hypothetical protein